MPIYYTGLNTTSLLSTEHDMMTPISRFTEIIFPEITDIELGWNYLLIWQNKKLFLLGKFHIDKNIRRPPIYPYLLLIPGDRFGSCKMAIPCKTCVAIFSMHNDIWIYKIYDKIWKKFPSFIDEDEHEYVVKLVELSYSSGIVALSNLGRVYRVPDLVEAPVKFVDIACGFDHTILLAEDGDVYSLGIGTRGQLGHNNLDDCNEPTLIEAIAGLEIAQISAGGWHNAVITNKGDLYTWGWNTSGELGVENEDTKVHAIPKLIHFKNDKGEKIEVNVKKVQCGNSFTVCLADDGSFWGCGTNKYGQLGKPEEELNDPHHFVKLDTSPLAGKKVKDFKCREWGTAIITE